MCFFTLLDLVGPRMPIQCHIDVNIPRQSVSSLGMGGLYSALLRTIPSSILLFRPAGVDSAFSIGRVLDISPVDLLNPKLPLPFYFEGLTGALGIYHVSIGTRR